MADLDRKHWNEQQKLLEQMLRQPKEHERALNLFCEQHALVHAGLEAPATFEDEVWEGLSEEMARRIPRNCVHSIAWMMWHTARCEDITMNMLVMDGDQVLLSGGWMEKMNIEARDTGNELSETELLQFNEAVNLTALRAYRLEVARQTVKVVRSLAPGTFQQKVKSERVPRIIAERAVVEAARYLVDYWSGRTIAGLMLMPATRHHMVHINEAMRQKRKK